MQNVILSKGQDDSDEIWLLEHFPVYTLGFGASEEHLLESSNIPVIRSDRGGEVTYHGPGQIVAYFLINLRRKKWGPKRFVNVLESSVIDFLGMRYKKLCHINFSPICFINLNLNFWISDFNFFFANIRNMFKFCCGVSRIAD